MMISIPEITYGILQRYEINDELDEAAEQVRTLGYATINSGYTTDELNFLSKKFNQIRDNYIEFYREATLRDLDEINTIRLLLAHGNNYFLSLALNKNLLSLLQRLIQGKFILNQQNGIINPPLENYNQGAWHRDLPYQHFVSTKPIAINALFCMDDFTIENGATYILPASHKIESFPSISYVRRNAIQVEAKAGSYIILDCMLFHAGGFNRTSAARRAVNHLYNIPYFKQQINIPKNIKDIDLLPEEKDILGFNCMEPSSIDNYLKQRMKKKFNETI